MSETFNARNGTVFHFHQEMKGEIRIDALWPTRVALGQNMLDVYLNAEDLMEFVLCRLRAEGIIHFSDEETNDLIQYIGKRRKE